MSLTRDTVLAVLARFTLPDGRDLVSADSVRALSLDDGKIRFVLEVAPEIASAAEPVRASAVAALEKLAGPGNVSAILTAHAAKPAPPDLKIGRHPQPQSGPAPVPGVTSIIAVASGKGGVGKSTVSANLAVAMSQAGKRVGLLDADVYGPSQPRMLGVSRRPSSPDGKIIEPLTAHGITMMSLGLMTKEDEAVIWRGPMLMGALQQMLNQVRWGDLDVLIIDLPPGTGDVQLTLAQKTEVAGAVIVSTPQDVALIDARKAINMFTRTSVPILGMIENMSTWVCPNCGHESHIFGHGGAEADASRQGIPFLGAVPLDLETRIAADSGTPVMLSNPDSPASAAFRAIADRLIAAPGLSG